MMTVSVGWMEIGSVGTLLACLLIGAIVSLVNKDKFFMVPGLIIGLVLGAAGVGFGAIADERIQHVRAIEAFQTEQRNILATMPEDWQQLNRLLNQTQTEPIRKAYVEAFLKTKTEPEISTDAYEVFYSASDCTNWGNVGCALWKSWLATKLMPFVLIDFQAAMENLE